MKIVDTKHVKISVNKTTTKEKITAIVALVAILVVWYLLKK